MGWQRWSIGIAEDDEMTVECDRHGSVGWGWRVTDVWGKEVLTAVKMRCRAVTSVTVGWEGQRGG
jgi:hypothetical protein